MLKFALNIALKMILICPRSLPIVKNVYLKLLPVHFGGNSSSFHEITAEFSADDFRFNIAMLTW